MKPKSCIFFFLILGLTSGCRYDVYQHQREKKALRKLFFAGPLAEGRLTIFVHGGKESMLSKIVHQIEYPHGIIPTSINRVDSIMGRLGTHLTNADPKEFPRDSFYFYSWSGNVTFPARTKAARRLYSVLKNHNGPITIITHSHGYNVVLNLSCVAAEYNDTSFKIDRLIMLAPPVQEVTKPYVKSPIFKEVYTFYSTADIMQVGDAQGLYWESYACTPPDVHIPLLSKRIFDPAPNMIQTRILLDWQSPGHLHFMIGRFISKLPQLLTLVKARADRDGFDYKKNFYIANIPLFNRPVHIVEPSELKRGYVP